MGFNSLGYLLQANLEKNTIKISLCSTIHETALALENSFFFKACLEITIFLTTQERNYNRFKKKLSAILRDFIADKFILSQGFTAA